MNYKQTSDAINRTLKIGKEYNPMEFEKLLQKCGLVYSQTTSRIIRSVSVCFEESRCGMYKRIVRISAVTPEVVRKTVETYRGRVSRNTAEEIEAEEERKDREMIDRLKRRGYRIFKEV